MADDRRRSGSADELHDDDELADVLAAELQRYATGVMPVVDPGAADPPRAPVAVPPLEDAPLLPRPRPSGRRAADPTESSDAIPTERSIAPERSGRRVQDVLTWADGEQPTPALVDDEPVRRRRGYLPPPGDGAEPPAARTPIERVLPTGPVTLPEPTAVLLQQMLQAGVEQQTAPHARHVSPPPLVEVAPLPDLEELRTTGPLAVPRPLYSDWEQSLRSIGRPRPPWEDDDAPLIGGAAPDAPTVAMAVPDLVGRSDAVVPPTGRLRRTRRRVEPVEPPPVSQPIEIVSGDEQDDEAVDEVATEHVRISAATSGAIDLPVQDVRPRTAPMIIERVRTAILQLPVMPASPTGSTGAAIAGRWTGAFAAPLLLLVAYGLGVVGAGPLDALPLLVGAAITAPAAVRSAAWSATARPGALEESVAFGGPAGRAWAIVLLLARLAVAAGVLFAVASTAAAWTARTGAVGGSATSASLAAAVVVGAVALAGALLPTRAAAILVLVLGALGLIGTVLLVLLLLPDAGSSNGGAPAAAAAAGAGVGLVLLLCGADTARWRTGIAASVGSAIGTVVAAVAGVLVLVLGLVAAAGAAGDPADALAAALSDGSAAGLAVPLGVVLTGSAVVLPLLVVRSTAASAARLLGGAERMGAAAAGLLGLAGALGLISLGADLAPAWLAIAGLAGVPVAAWAGVRTTGGDGARPLAAAVAAVGVIAGWALTDGLLPGAASPVLGLLGGHALRGGPPVGFGAAFVVGAVAGLLSRGAAVRGADTVEG